MPNSKQHTRKGNTPLKVYCLPEEKEIIVTNAKAAGKTTSAFLLAVGQGYRVPGITDAERVRDLAKVNGDLGRLGGLLKLWLTDDPRTQAFTKETIFRLLEKIEATQDEMVSIMRQIIRPKATPPRISKDENFSG